MSVSVRKLLLRVHQYSQLVRQCSTHKVKITGAKKLLYSEYGEPMKVLHAADDEVVFDERGDKVLVRMLAAPVNPADINTIQGKYAVRPELPSVPGNEGVAEVVALGEGARTGAGGAGGGLVPGDRVVPLTPALGTWRTHLVLSADDLYKVPHDLGLAHAATLTVNPCTAYRMLKDFVELKEGDVVLQNGANSAVGQHVIQLCRAWGLRSVNVVRDRGDPGEAAALAQALSCQGATHVLSESELRVTRLFATGGLPRPRLALNCVGGPSGAELARHLAPGATLVTYGAMSRQPLPVGAATLIFRDVRLRGFWMTAWNKRRAPSDPERSHMLREVVRMMECGDIRPAQHQLVPFDKYQHAIENTMSAKGMAGKKYILDFH